MPTYLKTLPAALVFVLGISPGVATAEADHAEIVKGRLELTLEGISDAVVTIDREPRGGTMDGVIDDAFVFQSSEPLPTDLLELDATGYIIARSDSILLLPEEGTPVLLAITPDVPGTAPRLSTLLDKALNPTIVDHGRRLTWLRHAEDLYGQAIQTLDAAKSPLFTLKFGGECTAGGPGSSSCTLGDCEVSSNQCGANEYPCCSEGFCGCSGGSGPPV